MWKDAAWIGVPRSEIERWNILAGDMTGRFAYFRCDASFPKGARLVLDISANSRYRLWINGEPVLSGPCKGDKYRHYYETVDVSAYLREGKNIFAAQVPYCEAEAVVAQEDERAAIYGVLTQNGGHRLAVQGEAFDEKGNLAGTITTGKAAWKVWLDGSFYLKSQEITRYLGAVCQEVDYRKAPARWKEGKFSAEDWAKPLLLEPVVTSDYMRNVGLLKRFQLKQREIPLLYEEEGAFIRELRPEEGTKDKCGACKGEGRCTEGVPYAGKKRENGILGGEVSIKAGEKRMFLLDAGAVTNAYPRFRFVKGRDARVSITYFEKFLCREREIRRDDYRNGEIVGLTDTLILDGSDICHEPFWYRTFRFVRIVVEAAEEEVVVGTPVFKKTGYPLEIRSAVRSSVPWVEAVFDMCVRTLKNCMMETYMDCPYYEQLQFIMDTRLQAAFNYAVSVDARLARKALDDFHHSMLPNGLIQGKYPSSYTQVISTFSLHYIYMLREYYWQTGDVKTVRGYFSDMDRILDYYDERIGDDHLVGRLGYWEFVDWQKAWAHCGGVPSAAKRGPSTIINLMYAYALKDAAELNEVWGRTGIAEEYLKRREMILRKVQELCWNPEKGLYREGPEVEEYSQHAQAWAILNGMTDLTAGRQIIKKAMEDESLIQCSFATSYEWFRAIEKVGMYGGTKKYMARWIRLLEKGCTTCPEEPGESRSDCHAWSALPMYEMVRVMAGVAPENPGWGRVRVKPEASYLPDLAGEVVTPKGKVLFEYVLTGKTHALAGGTFDVKCGEEEKEETGRWKYKISLPEGLDGTFVFPDGSSQEIRAGRSYELTYESAAEK